MYHHTSNAFGVTSKDNLSIIIDFDNNVLGKPSETVIEAISNLCGIELPGVHYQPINIIDYYDIALEYYTEIKTDDKTNKQLTIFLLYFSSFFHEIRHIHDLLSTIYGQEYLLRKFNYYQNFPLLLREIEIICNNDSDARLLIPLYENLGKMPKDFQEGWSLLIENYRSSKIKLRDFHNIENNKVSRITITHLLEGSAINTQFGMVQDLFGDKALFTLSEFIRKNHKSDKYLKIYNEIQQLFLNRNISKLPIDSIINFSIWCALNRPSTCDEDPSPSILFEALSVYIMNNLKSKNFSQVKKLTDKFLKSWGLKSFNSTKHISENNLNSMYKLLNGQYKRIYNEESEGYNLLNIYQSLKNIFTKMHGSIIKDKDGYFKPYKYISNLFLQKYPSVFMIIKYKEEVYGMMTLGEQLVDKDDWKWITEIATYFKLIIDGRGLYHTSFFDDICFNILTNKVNGFNLKISDNSDMFNW